MTRLPVDERFAAALGRLGPFEDRPRLAVAVSGGSDSLALTLLADRWARSRGGSVLGLTVDHRLRPAAAEEAVQVARWLAMRGMDHETLVWDAPQRGHAAARRARYRLLEEAARRRGVLHLLLGHTRDDQAETVLMRLVRNSGVDGLAGMPAVREGFAIRYLRPLLGFGRAELREWLRDQGQDWIDDPSNEDPRYTRSRFRSVGTALAAEGLTAAGLAETARRAGRARAALDHAVAEFAARAMVVAPEGWVGFDPRPLDGVPEEIAIRALSRAIGLVGGAEHPAALEGVERLFVAIRDRRLGAGRTLGGCRIVPARGGRIAVMREPGRVTDALPVRPGRHWWDRRFLITLPEADGIGRPGLEIRAIGAAGPRLRKGGGPASSFPATVVATLPGLWCGDDLVGLPDLLAGAEDAGSFGECLVFRTVFTPVVPLAGAGFPVV